MLRENQMITKDAKERKGLPVATGVLDYFPQAILAISEVSRVGNDQHHPGEALWWERGRSNDHSDCAIRHFMERGTLDTDGISHTAKACWRMLALLQTEIEEKNIASLPVQPKREEWPPKYESFHPNAANANGTA